MPRELRGANAIAYNCTDREILIEGRAGTGKTIGWGTKAHHTALKYPGCRQLFLRRWRANLTESVIPTFENKVLLEGHPLIGGIRPENRHSYTYENGSKIVLAGLDDPGKTFSTEWDRIYINEGTEIGLDSHELLSRSLRNFKTPYHQIIVDCNPREPGHWLNQRATKASDKLRNAASRADYKALQAFNQGPQDGKMRRLISVHQDNPFYFDAQKWEWTPAGREYIGGLEAMSGHNRARMLMGLWVAADGVVYKEFDENTHMVAPFKLPSDWPIYIGIDPGYDHPCAILWIAIGYDGTHYVIDELYRGGLGVAEHAKDIHARNKGRNIRGVYGDPQYAFSRTMHAMNGESIAEQFGRYGIIMHPWPRTGTDEKAMVEGVRDLLINQKLKVFHNCTNTKMEFQSWCYKRDKNGQPMPGDDAYEDKTNHAQDVLKGIVALKLAPIEGKIEVYGEGDGDE